MSASLTPAREFAARQLAAQRLIRAGMEARAKQASRIAARLFHEGRSVDAAAREAATLVIKTSPQNDGGAA